MGRKMVYWTNKAGDVAKVYYQDGVCKNQAVLDKVLVGEYAPGRIRQTGDNTLKPKVAYKSKKQDANNPAFLGQQAPTRIAPKVDEDGKPHEKRKRVALNIDRVRELAEAGNTIKQAAEILGVSYPTIFTYAKTQNIPFVKERKSHSSKAKVDNTELINNMKGLTELTMKEVATKLEISYTDVVRLAKANSLTFKAGKHGGKGRTAKPVDTELIEKLKGMTDKTVKQVATELNLKPVVVYGIAKKAGLTFVKGKKGFGKGRAKKMIDPALIEKMKGMTDKTVKQVATELGVKTVLVYTIAKANGLTFVKGKKGGFGGGGRKKKPVDQGLLDALKGLTHLTVKEAATKLDKSVSVVYTLAKANSLVFQKGLRGAVPKNE